MAKKAFLLGVNTLGLQYAEKDTELMNECLTKYDYEIVKPYKKERHSILEQFEEMLDKCNRTDTVIFHYSGHGVLTKGKLRLVLDDDASKEVSNKLRISEITEPLEDCRAENKLIILDCCHASAVQTDLHLDLPDAYRLLTASTRLEKSKELDELQASFLTYQIHQTLMQPPAEICADNRIQVSAFYQWLVKVAKQHNLNHSIQVPIPNLLGNEKANFEIATCDSKAATEESPKMLARRLLKTLLPAQFQDVLLLYEVPEEYLSRQAPQMTQIGELLKYAHQKEGEQLTKLLEMINQVRV